MLNNIFTDKEHITRQTKHILMGNVMAVAIIHYKQYKPLIHRFIQNNKQSIKKLSSDSYARNCFYS